MNEPNNVTTVLLGAGASVPAGLPTSVGLTKRIADEASGPGGRLRKTGAALHLAIGAMIAHDTAQGNRYDDGIDAERLFSAVQMLANRDTLEIAPFVTSWIRGLEGLGAREVPTFWNNDFNRALLNRGGDPGKAIKNLIESVLDHDSGQRAFRALELEMVEALHRILTVDAPKVDYLAPLLSIRPSPIQVATLNYDRTIEVLADRAGMSLNTGADQWTGGHDWSWVPSDIHLLKLHGSLDWRLSTPQDSRRIPEPKLMVTEGEQHYGQELGVVFGQRGKLTSDGPFLAMLRAFDDFLARSGHLVVVGYSFRDDHINTAIRRWFNNCAAPSVTIIDKTMPLSWNYDPDRRFANDLRRALYEDHGNAPRPEHRLIEADAAVGLREAFGDGPAIPPTAPGSPAAKATSMPASRDAGPH